MRHISKSKSVSDRPVQIFVYPQKYSRPSDYLPRHDGIEESGSIALNSANLGGRWRWKTGVTLGPLYSTSDNYPYI